jgi:hypothetical protein
MHRTRPFRHAPHIGVLAALVAVTACGSQNDDHSGAAPSSTAATSRSSADGLADMTEADIRRSALGCLHPPPYPMDGGSTCLLRDGRWFSFSGWGNQAGRFRIEGNRVLLDNPLSTPKFTPPRSFAFFRNRQGAMFIRYGEKDRPRPFTPYPVNKLLRDVR